MPTIQISKLQMRRGPAADLPNPSLDSAEIGFADDSGRLFIGQSTPQMGNPNYNRDSFPFENIEILTEASPLGKLLAPVISDNQMGFIVSVPLVSSAGWHDFDIYDSTHTATIFHVDLPNGANATIDYFVYDSSNNPIRQGTLNVIWNTNMVGEPLCDDTTTVSSDTSYSDISWQAVEIGSYPNQHVKLQYKNIGSTLGHFVYFKIDRPLLP
jgi:hypothetical protein